MTHRSRTKIKVSNFKLMLTEEDKRFILKKTRDVLSSSRWTVGPMGENFEKTFKKYVGASHAVAVSNGGVALVAILQALKVPEGSIVICPTLTAPPTPHAILASNMKVVFCDSDPQDLGLDPEDVEKKLIQYKGEVSAVITVHVGGWISPKVKNIFMLCQKRGIPLIEDCAHAHGSWLEDKHAGSIAGIAAFSFFMTKPLASGEGGIVTAEDKTLTDTIRIIRNYGKNEQGKHVLRGFNYKMSEFDAVVALWAAVNGSRLGDERRKIAAIYDELLKDLAGVSVVNVPHCKGSYYKYIILLDSHFNRDKVKENLLYQHGIEASGGVYYTLCHEEPYFRSIPTQVLNVSECFPRVESFAKQHLCLPLYPGLTIEEQHLVVQGLRKSLLSCQ